MVTMYCYARKIDGAQKKGSLWLVLIDAKKPVDGKTIAVKKSKE